MFLIKNFKAVFYYLSSFLIAFIFTLILLPLTFLPARIRYNKLYFFLAWLWAWLMVKSSCISYSVENSHYLTHPRKSSIILSNHASALDIPLVEVLLSGYPHVWLSKDAYGKIPLFGTLLTRMHILVNRDDDAQSLSIFKRAYSLCAGKDRHLVMFPEGTRHADGAIHDFYAGFAVLAYKLKKPIIPILIVGLEKIFPPGRLMIDSSKCLVKIRVGEPIEFTPLMTRDEFVVHVRNWFVKNMDEVQEK